MITAALFTIAAIAFAVALWLALHLYRDIARVDEHTRELGAAVAVLAQLQSSTLAMVRKVDERVEEMDSVWCVDDDDDSDEDDEEIDEPTTPYERPANWWKNQ
jgi:1,2-phenylacetyl-CoA epoxidase PaaB subunit